MTRIVAAPDESAAGIREAAELLRKGELVAFPTETVYGLGADGLNPKAAAAIFDAKGRPQDNPLILHIADLKALDPLVTSVPAGAREALAHLWPGPITFIFYRSTLVPDVVTAGGPTVAIRMPQNPIARALIRAAGTPIAAPSANRSGRPSPTTAGDVLEDMDGRIPMILDGGSSSIGVESTVVDLTVTPPVILRPGFHSRVTLEADFPGIEDVTPEAAQVSSDVPKSPGMKYRHYAPKAPLSLYIGPGDAVTARLAKDTEGYRAAEKRVGIMAFDPQIDALQARLDGGVTYASMGPAPTHPAVAQRLFYNMRVLDRAGVDVILAVGVPEEGVGIAVMNRLRKASGGKWLLVE
ncbi:MAG: L-threonylcarbamoyladenylate synthase [Peptoniphilaceae bacterium]|nr:L-threonylcarbamoyladenylate synthase [Peptoniphilaceae bacterium]